MSRSVYSPYLDHWKSNGKKNTIINKSQPSNQNIKYNLDLGENKNYPKIIKTNFYPNNLDQEFVIPKHKDIEVETDVNVDVDDKYPHISEINEDFDNKYPHIVDQDDHSNQNNEKDNQPKFVNKKIKIKKNLKPVSNPSTKKVVIRKNSDKNHILESNTSEGSKKSNIKIYKKSSPIIRSSRIIPTKSSPRNLNKKSEIVKIS